MIDITNENKRDLMIEKFIKINALTKTIVKPIKNDSQLDIVLGLPSGKGDILLFTQLFNFDFMRSANINPDIRQINAPQESQKIGSSIGLIC